jgi:hypothetical protein
VLGTGPLDITRSVRVPRRTAGSACSFCPLRARARGAFPPVLTAAALGLCLAVPAHDAIDEDGDPTGTIPCTLAFLPPTGLDSLRRAGTPHSRRPCNQRRARRGRPARRDYDQGASPPRLGVQVMFCRHTPHASRPMFYLYYSLSFVSAPLPRPVFQISADAAAAQCAAQYMSLCPRAYDDVYMQCKVLSDRTSTSTKPIHVAQERPCRHPASQIHRPAHSRGSGECGAHLRLARLPRGPLPRRDGTERALAVRPCAEQGEEERRE